MNFNHYSQTINKKVNSCILNLSDLNSLARVLAEKAQESIKYDLDQLETDQSIPHEKL